MQRTKCLHVCLHIDWNPYSWDCSRLFQSQFSNFLERFNPISPFLLILGTSILVLHLFSVQSYSSWFVLSLVVVLTLFLINSKSVLTISFQLFSISSFIVLGFINGCKFVIGFVTFGSELILAQYVTGSQNGHCGTPWKDVFHLRMSERLYF